MNILKITIVILKQKIQYPVDHIDVQFHIIILVQYII